MQIRVVNKNEYEKVRDFYYLLIDEMKDAKFSPGWEKDVYPSQDFLRKSIENGELYIGEENGEIISSMVVNHEYNDGYKKIQWSVQAEDSEILVVHALGVKRSFSGRGIAKQMVRKVMDMARNNQIKSIRLDVLEGNLPAEKAYMKIGFVYLDMVQMYYEDTGWTNYKVYEFVV